MAEFHLEIPLREDDIKELRIADLVYFSGEAWTCRSRLQRYVFDEGHSLPFSTKDRNLLIHAGPVIVRQQDQWQLMGYAPTSSIRFEKWGAKSVKEWNLKAIIGKTTMGQATMKAMQERICVHLTPVGITPQLYQDRTQVKDVYWYKELGSIEAAWILELTDLGPFLVDIDSTGQNHFEKLDVWIDQKRKMAYQKLNIPEDFEFTKLY